MSTRTPVPTGQGTRESTTDPWDSYAAEMETRMSPEMAAAVASYAERSYNEASSSNQNKEELCRQKEINQEISKEYQWIKPEEYADYGARIGAPMTHAQFITTLRKAGVQCFYKQHIHHDKATLCVVTQYGMVEPEADCWVQIGFMPELSMMNFDSYGAPLAERRRGWRTCLLQLILKGRITEETANKYFGRPKQTEQYARYNRTLSEFRKIGGRLE